MVFWVDIFGRLNFFLSDCLESGMGMTEIIEFLLISDNMESRARLFSLPIGGRMVCAAVYTVNIFFISDCLETGMGMTEIIEFLLTSDNMET